MVMVCTFLDCVAVKMQYITTSTNKYLLLMLFGYGRTFFTILSGHIFLGIFSNWSIQCAAVSINFKLICAPPQSIAQFESSRITCHGTAPRFELQPPTILIKFLLRFFFEHTKEMCFSHKYATSSTRSKNL